MTLRERAPNLEALRRAAADHADPDALAELLVLAARRGDPALAAEVLEWLLAAWRAEPWPALGEAIELAGQRFESEAARTLRGAVRGRRALDDALWHATEVDHGPLERGALLDTLMIGQNALITARVERLVHWPADPRTASAIARWLAALPARDPAMRPVWTRVFELLDRLGDPRTPAQLAALVAALGARRWLGRLEKAVRDLARSRLPAPTQPPDPRCSHPAGEDRRWARLLDVARSLGGVEPSDTTPADRLDELLAASPAPAPAPQLAGTRRPGWSLHRAVVRDLVLPGAASGPVACLLHHGDADERYRLARTLWLGDPQSGRTRLALEDVHAIALSADGRWLATARHYDVELYDTASLQCTRRLQALRLPITSGSYGKGKNRIRDLAFSADGRKLAVLADHYPGSWDQAHPVLLDLDTGAVQAQWPPLDAATRYLWDAARKCIRLSPDGRRLAVTAGGYCMLADTARPGEVILRDAVVPDAANHGIFDPYESCGFDPSGRLWLCLRSDGELEVRDADTGALLAREHTAIGAGWIEPNPGPEGTMLIGQLGERALRIGPDGKPHEVQALDGVMRGASLGRWDRAAQSLVVGTDTAALHWLGGEATTVLQARLPYADAAERVGESRYGRVAAVVELACPKGRGLQTKVLRDVSVVLLAPHGRWIATAKQSIKVLPLPAGKATTLRGHETTVTVLVAAPDARWLASADRKGLVQLWQPDEGRLLFALSSHQAQVRALAAHPGGHLLASLDAHAVLALHEVDTGRELARHALPREPLAEALAMDWFADGRRLLVGTGEALHMVEARSGRVERVAGEVVGPRSLARHPSAELWAIGTQSGCVWLWQPGDAPRLVSRGHEAAVRALAFDGDRLLIGSGHADVDTTVVELG